MPMDWTGLLKQLTATEEGQGQCMYAAVHDLNTGGCLAYLPLEIYPLATDVGHSGYLRHPTEWAVEAQLLDCVLRSRLCMVAVFEGPAAERLWNVGWGQQFSGRPSRSPDRSHQCSRVQTPLRKSVVGGCQMS
ncbi:hypothetical protein IscW_ISCW015865 [Ixodes scapularis]|uniref:Uncharacterized protein n=1 Tax=Ixodes scapularis TaxID=6945 RepID=B7P5C5_IXOSC|nr:hypothetical protein IscW_ISCW015865 [Ixodes scapularis]|eukprot:XP_002407237.1 hypothetical protein IscW_ISCW015865 [Ixodes scapularis]